MELMSKGPPPRVLQQIGVVGADGYAARQLIGIGLGRLIIWRSSF